MNKPLAWFRLASFVKREQMDSACLKTFASQNDCSSVIFSCSFLSVHLFHFRIHLPKAQFNFFQSLFFLYSWCFFKIKDPNFCSEKYLQGSLQEAFHFKLIGYNMLIVKMFKNRTVLLQNKNQFL